MRKKIVSLLVVLTMVLAMMPGTFGADTAYAAGGVTPKTSPPRNPAASEELKSKVFADVPATVSTEDGSTTSTKCWHVVTDSEGNNVAVSGIKGKGGSPSTSTMTLTFLDDAELNFEYYVSTEARYDKCTISQSGSVTKNIVTDESGDNGWKQKEGISVKRGDVLTFTYTKDISGDRFDDCFAIRNMTAGSPIVVTFHANGGMGEDYTQNFFGTNGKALASNTFTKDHASFAGWSTSADGQVEYADGDTIAPSENMDLFAQWDEAYEVTFDFNDDGATPNKVINIPQNTAIGEENIPSASRTGYKVGGWYDGATKIDGDTIIDSDKTFTAKWTPIEYTVHFDANGGEGSADDAIVKYGEIIPLPNDAFSKDSYHQGGWGTSTSYAAYAADSEIKNLKNADGDEVTLYAIWKGNGLDLKVDPNYEGAETIDRRAQVGQNYNYVYNDERDSSTFSSLVDPKREGYNFKGWFTEAEGGTEVTTSYKFTSDEDFTMYAHWAESVTITFDAATNGGSIPAYSQTRTIDKGAALGSLPSTYNVTAPTAKPKLIGWFTQPEGGEEVTAATVFDEDTTVYAQFRDYQQTITFNANGGEGSMEQFTVARNIPALLPPNTFTREGYIFDKWVNTISTWSTPKYYEDMGEYTWSQNYVYNDGSQTLYATWKVDVFTTAFNAIEKALPKDKTVSVTGSLDLPTSNSGYTISYSSDDEEYVTNNGEVIKLPESGIKTVTLTATVTDTYDNKTKAEEYVIHILSPQAQQDKQDLQDIATTLDALVAIYGQDENAVAMLQEQLHSKGHDGISVLLKEAAKDAEDRAGLQNDGTIDFYFDPQMEGSSVKDESTFDATFVLTKNGVSVEKTVGVTVPWDEAKIEQAIQDNLDRITIPEGPIAERDLTSLPYYGLVEGVSQGSTPDSEFYNNYRNFEIWGQAGAITWESSNRDVLAIGSKPDYPPYSPYSVTMMRDKNDTPITLTASITARGITVSKDYDTVIKGDVEGYKEKIRKALEQRLENGIGANFEGLKDYETGESIDVNNVTSDIKFPTTRDFKDNDGKQLDGKYQPVNIVTDNRDVIDYPTRVERSDPDDPTSLYDTGEPLNNAARVYVYRPEPGEDPVDVTITVSITDLETGVKVSKDIKVTVQPLDPDDIEEAKAFMEKAVAGYWDGLKAGNTDKNDITESLTPFQEINQDASGNLIFANSSDAVTDNGVKPDNYVEVPGSNDSDYRKFNLTRNTVIADDTLALASEKPEYDTEVTIDSYLSHSVYGEYYKKYRDAGNTELAEKYAPFYRQHAEVTVVVKGLKGANPNPAAKITVTVQIKSDNEEWLTPMSVKADKNAAAGDVVEKVLRENGFTYKGSMTYIRSITNKAGKTLSEYSNGDNSGWMFRVNGELVGTTLDKTTLKDGDRILLFFTNDYTKEPAQIEDQPAPVAKTIGTPKIKTIGKMKKRQMKVKIAKKAKNAKIYKISYRVAGKHAWQSKWTTKDVYIIKGLKKGKLYEFKATGFDKKNGQSGADSNIARRYMHSVSKLKVKAKKGKKIKATWTKCKSADGYVVKYATNKKMKGAKTIKLEGAAKNKTTIKGLKKGKKYYVQVRCYKKYQGKTYSGILSPKKKAKAK